MTTTLWKGSSLSDVLERVQKRHGEEAWIVDALHRKDQVEVEVAVRAAVVPSPRKMVASSAAAPSPARVRPLNPAGEGEARMHLAVQLLGRPLSARERVSVSLLQKHVLQALRARFETVPMACGCPVYTRLVFTGAAGSGKTTALLKLAASCILNGRPVHLAAFGEDRMHHHRLEAFAQAAGVPLHPLADGKDLHKLAASVPAGHRILVDGAPGLPDLAGLPAGFMVCLAVPATLNGSDQPLQQQDPEVRQKTLWLLTQDDTGTSPAEGLHTAFRGYGVPLLGCTRSPVLTDPWEPAPFEAWAAWISAPPPAAHEAPKRLAS
jgi:hypothetical protein